MTVDVFYRNAEFYDQTAAAGALEAVHTPVIGIEISEPAEITDRKLSAHAAGRAPVREPANRTAAAPAGPPVAAPAMIRTVVLDPAPAGHGTASGKRCDHIIRQNRRSTGAKLSHCDSRRQLLPRSGSRTDGARDHSLLNIIVDTHRIQLCGRIIREYDLIGNDISGAGSTCARPFRGGGTNAGRRAVLRLAEGRHRQVELLHHIFFTSGKGDMRCLRSLAKGGIHCDSSWRQGQTVAAGIRVTDGPGAFQADMTA